ncbi:MAG TPA: hypothetical protein VG125_33895 [Pirellulales bacterium]|nr:hypothetical protein [Pirellulales bacterium]
MISFVDLNIGEGVWQAIIAGLAAVVVADLQLVTIAIQSRTSKKVAGVQKSLAENTELTQTVVDAAKEADRKVALVKEDLRHQATTNTKKMDEIARTGQQIQAAVNEQIRRTDQ